MTFEDMLDNLQHVTSASPQVLIAQLNDLDDPQHWATATNTGSLLRMQARPENSASCLLVCTAEHNGIFAM